MKLIFNYGIKKEINTIEKEKFYDKPINENKKRNDEPIIKTIDTEKKESVIPSSATSNDAMEISLNHVQDLWGDFIKKLEEKNSKLSHFLEDSKLKSVNNETIVIELLNGNRFQQDSLEKDINQIEDVFNQVFNKKMEIEFFLNENLNKTEPIKKNEKREHPLFDKVMEKFDGEIIR